MVALYSFPSVYRCLPAERAKIMENRESVARGIGIGTYFLYTYKVSLIFGHKNDMRYHKIYGILKGKGRLLQALIVYTN